MKKPSSRGKEERGTNIKPSPYKEEIDPDLEPPYFSLRYLTGDYCLTRCERNEKAAFAETLHRLSKCTWRELKLAPRHGIGYERIDRDAIRPGIPGHVSDDVHFIAFRFFGKAPMVGYRDRVTFYVLWLDRDFTVYPHD